MIRKSFKSEIITPMNRDYIIPVFLRNVSFVELIMSFTVTNKPFSNVVFPCLKTELKMFNE